MRNIISYNRNNSNKTNKYINFAAIIFEKKLILEQLIQNNTQMVTVINTSNVNIHKCQNYMYAANITMTTILQTIYEQYSMGTVMQVTLILNNFVL